MEASNIPSERDRAMAEAVVDWLAELPEEAGDLTPAQLIDALGAAGLTLAASDPNIHLRDAVVSSLRRGAPIEQTLALVGQAVQLWLAEDHNFGVQSEAQPRYPYVDGDFLILGPEIFTVKEDSELTGKGVISWKGENYVIQPPAGAGG